MRRGVSALLVGVLGIALLLLPSRPAGAWGQSCPDPNIPNDFLTGGGFILHFGAHANFAIGGACKKGGDGHGLWGHLEYIDHGTGLNVHWTTITGYFEDFVLGDPRARIICGTARTNQFGDVFFAARAADDGPPGPGNGNDFFDLEVRSQTTGALVYVTNDDGIFPHPLAGGNIMLHKPINQTATFSVSCPAFTG